MKDKEGIPLSFYYWIHCRIYEQSYKGIIKKEQVLLVLRQFFNIEKRMCPLIIKELELLNLLKTDDGFIRVMKTKSREEVIFELSKKLDLL